MKSTEQETIKGLREALDRCRAWVNLLARSAPDGDNRVLVDADVAAEHAADLTTLLAALASDPPPFRGEALSEQAARIIDPAAFALRDELVRESLLGPSWTPELTRQATAHCDSQVTKAFAKAREILALSPALVTPGEEDHPTGAREMRDALIATVPPPPIAPGSGIAKHMPSQEWLSRHVETDPDDADVEVRPAVTPGVREGLLADLKMLWSQFSDGAEARVKWETYRRLKTTITTLPTRPNTTEIADILEVWAVDKRPAGPALGTPGGREALEAFAHPIDHAHSEQERLRVRLLDGYWVPTREDYLSAVSSYGSFITCVEAALAALTGPRSKSGAVVEVNWRGKKRYISAARKEVQRVLDEWFSDLAPDAVSALCLARDLLDGDAEPALTAPVARVKDERDVALKAAAAQFRTYEAHHRTKDKADFDKAQRNAEMAEMCEAALGEKS